MTFYTRSGLPLNFEESEKVWNNPEAICNRKPIDIAVDGQAVCYVCGHDIDEHSSKLFKGINVGCRVCLSLSMGVKSPDKLTSQRRKIQMANARKPLI